MAVHELRLPHLDTYNFGVGADRLSGMAMNQVVVPTPAPPMQAQGSAQAFEVSRVTSTHELQARLGIDVNASYGCAAFGAGVSARFSFAQESEVHSASLFMTVTASIHLADLSIPDCVLTETAAKVVDRQDIFAARYGDMFLRACRRGGVFVGLIKIETFDEAESTRIETELRGSYGLFSRSQEANFAKITTDHEASVYCSVYTEGGPAVRIDDPTDPLTLLNAANAWIQALHEQPEKYAMPYEWTLAPITIAEGPLPPNQADIDHAQDVIKFCAQERAVLLDQLNLLNWWSRHPDKYDWSAAATPDQIAAAARATQTDLDTVSGCASAAINSPTQAKMPADFATGQGRSYPLSTPLPVGPKALPGQPPEPPEVIVVPSLIGISASDFQNNRDPFPQVTADFDVSLVLGEPRTGWDGASMVIYAQDPAPGSPVLKHSGLSLTCYSDAN